MRCGRAKPLSLALRVSLLLTTQHTMKTSHQKRLPIEEYALLTENAPELGAKLDHWYSFYQPATPGECEWLDMAVMASVQARRVLACLTATVNHQINTAFFDFDREQEDEVARYRAMLETQPGAAVVGLKRSALGVRFLIGRWERLLRLIQEEGTLYGNDRNEAINYQGARASKPEDLFQSEGAYLTWLYCLMCQPAPKDEQFVAMGNEKWMPASLMDRPPAEWLGEASLCRKLLVERAERELAYLRPREERLRLNYETPARDGAEIRRQVLQGPVGARLLREAESHNRHYHRAYNAFLKGRAYSAKTGRLPGQPEADLHGEADETPATVVPVPVSESMPAEQGVARRKQAAEALAPGGENGIGPPIFRGDNGRAAVVATGPLAAEELLAQEAAENEAGMAGV